MDPRFYYICQSLVNVNRSFYYVSELIKKKKISILTDRTIPDENFHVHFINFIHERMEKIWQEYYNKIGSITSPNDSFKTGLASIINHRGFFTHNDITFFLNKYLDKDSPNQSSFVLAEKRRTAGDQVNKLYILAIRQLNSLSGIFLFLSRLITNTLSSLEQEVVHQMFMTEYDVELKKEERDSLKADEAYYKTLQTTFDNLEKKSNKLVLSLTQLVREKNPLEDLEKNLRDLKEIKQESENLITKTDEKLNNLLKFQGNSNIVDRYLEFLADIQKLEVDIENAKTSADESIKFCEKHEKNMQVYENTVNFFQTEVIKEYNRCVHSLVFRLTPIQNLNQIYF